MKTFRGNLKKVISANNIASFRFPRKNLLKRKLSWRDLITFLIKYFFKSKNDFNLI